MKNQLIIDKFQEASEVAEIQGKKLSTICNINGKFIGYRLTDNYVRCHIERTVGIGKIRKLLGMPGWVYFRGNAIAA